MGFSYVVIALLFCLGTGSNGGADLLDMISTDGYWQAKHQAVSVTQLEGDAAPSASPENLAAAIKDLESDEFKVRNQARKRIAGIGSAALPMLRKVEQSTDPEVKAAATELVHELESRRREREVRQLMAIRTLGERKETGAVALLKTLLASKELFVPTYAARALAQIQGRAYTPVDHRGAVHGDLKLLAENASVVAQCTGLLTKPLTVDAVIDAAIANHVSGRMMGVNGPKALDRNALLQRGVRAVLMLAERVGDVRFDGVNVEVSSDAGGNAGSAVILLRGEFDSAAILEAMKSEINATQGGGHFGKEGIVEEFSEQTVTMLFPSNEQVAIVFGGKPETINVVKGKVLGALQTGVGTLMNDPAIALLLKQVDTQSSVWAVAKLNDAMQSAKVFEAFDTLVLTTTQGEEDLAFRVAGEGKDAEKIKGAVDELSTQIAAMLTQVQMLVGVEKQLAPVLEFMQSIKVEGTGATAKLTGTFKESLVTDAVANGVPMLEILEDHEDEMAPTTQP